MPTKLLANRYSHSWYGALPVNVALALLAACASAPQGTGLAVSAESRAEWLPVEGTSEARGDRVVVRPRKAGGAYELRRDDVRPGATADVVEVRRSARGRMLEGPSGFDRPAEECWWEYKHLCSPFVALDCSDSHVWLCK